MSNATSFSDRLASAEPFEHFVASQMTRRSWSVGPFGQGEFPDAIKDAIFRSRSRLRHLPDLIAGRDGELVTIDCKNRLLSTHSNRYAISRECVDFGLQWTAFGVPTFYVFGNMGVLLPTEVMSYGRLGRKAAGGGSYYLVPGSLAHDFDDVFGAPAVNAAA